MKLLSNTVAIELTEDEREQIVDELATIAEDTGNLPEALDKLWYLLTYDKPQSKSSKAQKGKKSTNYRIEE